MTRNYSVYVGTVGLSLWLSNDGGDKWRWVSTPFGTDSPYEGQVRAVVVDPHDQASVYAGDEKGLFRSPDRGATWERIHGPMDGQAIWSVEIDPTDSDTLFVGTRPPAIYRTRDRGKTWTALAANLPQQCPIGIPRVTGIRVDPLDHRQVWAGLEVAGVYRSLDGGDSWARIFGDMTEEHGDADIHNFNLAVGTSIRPRNGDFAIRHPVAARAATAAYASGALMTAPGKTNGAESAVLTRGHATTALITTRDYVYATDDAGETVRMLLDGKRFSFPFLRGTAVKPDDPLTIYVGIGDAPVGGGGGLVLTRDGGQTWEEVALPQTPNSPIFHIATHPAEPNLVLAASHMGELFRSEDAGDHWEKLKRELTEIRAMTWAPN